MIDNLVDRLETLGRGLGRQFIIYNEAAAEIERLRAENARLREALKPFAYYADLIPDDIGDTASASGTVGDLRAAKAALEGK